MVRRFLPPTRLPDEFFGNMQRLMDQQPDVTAHGVGLGVAFLVWQWPPMCWVRLARLWRGKPEPIDRSSVTLRIPASPVVERWGNDA